MYSKEMMKIRKNAYLTFALLESTMNAYEYNEGDLNDNLATIDCYCTEFVDGILLPSNRMGTPLAVALETHSFKSALYLMENAKRLGVSLSTVLRDDDYKSIDVNEELDFALSYFSISDEKNKIKMYSRLSDKEMQKIEVIHLKEELEALEKIKTFLKKRKNADNKNTSLKI